MLPRLGELHHLCLGSELQPLWLRPATPSRSRPSSGTATSPATSYTWSVVPPAPTITSEPTNPSTTSSASFKYADTLSGVSFSCSLDASSYSSCPSSGVTYPLSSSGSHSFSVKAQSGSASSAPASYTWAVTTPAPSIVSEPANPVASVVGGLHLRRLPARGQLQVRT